jgi:alpha/beta superfamily hydrolase
MPQKGLLLPLLAICTVCLSACADQPRTKAEESACWGYLEEAAFNRWQKLAQRGGHAPKLRGYRYRPIAFATRDGRKLFGYRVDKEGGGRITRALIVAQGNSILADHLTDDLPYFAARGYTVFNFDHRGYGKSTGVAGVKAIVDDYKEIHAFVKSQGFTKIFGFGMSFGGIVLSNTVGQGLAYDALVIDSSPATLPVVGFCSDRFDPLKNVPADASNIMVISGSNDDVIPEADVAPMGAKVRNNGGQWLQTSLRHPMAESRQDKVSRFGKVAEFFEKF